MLEEENVSYWRPEVSTNEMQITAVWERSGPFQNPVCLVLESLNRKGGALVTQISIANQDLEADRQSEGERVGSSRLPVQARIRI